MENFLWQSDMSVTVTVVVTLKIDHSWLLTFIVQSSQVIVVTTNRWGFLRIWVSSDSYLSASWHSTSGYRTAFKSSSNTLTCHVAFPPLHSSKFAISVLSSPTESTERQYNSTSYLEPWQPVSSPLFGSVLPCLRFRQPSTAHWWFPLPQCQLRKCTFFCQYSWGFHQWFWRLTLFKLLFIC